jgi:hypothetical protein
MPRITIAGVDVMVWHCYDQQCWREWELPTGQKPKACPSCGGNSISGESASSYVPPLKRSDKPWANSIGFTRDRIYPRWRGWMD